MDAVGVFPNPPTTREGAISEAKDCRGTSDDFDLIWLCTRALVTSDTCVGVAFELDCVFKTCILPFEILRTGGMELNDEAVETG
jgi:hypothetical protein